MSARPPDARYWDGRIRGVVALLGQEHVLLDCRHVQWHVLRPGSNARNAGTGISVVCAECDWGRPVDSEQRVAAVLIEHPQAARI